MRVQAEHRVDLSTARKIMEVESMVMEREITSKALEGSGET